MAGPPSQQLTINGVAIDLVAETLHDRHGDPVPMRRQAFAVLRHLLGNAGRLVTKEELMAAVWPGIAVTDGGVYGAAQGPRLESAAEIDRMARDGATIVGMTGMPEASLARELELPYASICVVVNHAAGRGDSRETISMEALVRTLDAGMDNVRTLLDHLVPMVAPEADAIPATPPEEPPPSTPVKTPS